MKKVLISMIIFISLFCISCGGENNSKVEENCWIEGLYDLLNCKDDLSETKIIDDLFADKTKTYLIISHRIDKLAMKGAIGLDIDTLLG